MATSAEMHLMYRVGNASICHFPFPPIYVRDVFPEDFYRRIRQNLPPKKALSTRAQEFTNEALLVQDYTISQLTPHTDTPSKVFSFLFYLPEDDRLSHLGTSIYMPKDRRYVSGGTKHLKSENFDRLITMPYRPNTLFAFLKTPNAFHGVEPIQEAGVRRDLLLYDIKVKEPVRPAAAAPRSNVQATF